MGENTVKEKSFGFAIRIVNLYNYLIKDKQEYIMSKQLMRSGTSIGANVNEALRAVSRRDFSNKLSIALKEASESDYWINLLYATKYINEGEYISLIEDCTELNKLLISIVKSTNNNSEL